MSAAPRRSLCALPTPLHAAPRLGAWLGGVDLWIKRDDLTGLAFGGNKARKLEFLVGDAIAHGHDTLLTAGAAQSNHCRQTAAAAAASGLACHLALGGRTPASWDGNLLLDHVLGAHVHWCGEHRKGEDLARIADDLRHAGRSVYVVPYGGSDRVGALGYVHAAAELLEQIHELDLHPRRVVVASSSGGTQAGLLVGLAHARAEIDVVGMRVDKTDAHPAHADAITDLARATARSLGSEFTGRAQLYDDALFAAYGEPTAFERACILAAAREEGLLLDPVYTGRAFAGLVQLVRSGEIARGETVVFWHTGGTPALFAHGDLLQP